MQTGIGKRSGASPNPASRLGRIADQVTNSQIMRAIVATVSDRSSRIGPERQKMQEFTIAPRAPAPARTEPRRRAPEEQSRSEPGSQGCVSKSAVSLNISQYMNSTLKEVARVTKRVTNSQVMRAVQDATTAAASERTPGSGGGPSQGVAREVLSWLLPPSPSADAARLRRRRAEAQPPKWVPCCAGLAALAAAATVWAFPPIFDGAPDDGSAETATEGEEGDGPAPAARAPAQESFAIGIGANRVDGAPVLQVTEDDGVPFVPADRLPWSPGQVLTIYCLMEAPLDSRTERNWRDAGMCASGTPTGDARLRRVTIASQSALDNLVDWHVRAVAPADGKPVRKDTR